ncbi:MULTISPECIES: ATP-binding protein [Mycobacteriaceae]|uniref:ATP-binding protein n=1 Tax=Mycobacteriaceae TaxID=1762 RepID=UPI0026EDCD5E|nr:ATP-binding protein [Mycolicibacterium bacteremicum]
MTLDVSAERVVVRLNAASPQATALNAGSVQRFPRINGYVLIPSEIGYTVGTITWIGTNRAVLPVALRDREQKQGIVDLPLPDRSMTVTLLGTLQGSDRSCAPTLSRGVTSYPTVGDPVLIPTTVQSEAIAHGDKDARVVIGTSPLAGDIPVRIDPDKLFGRHLAILGNTGSGKSCTVAGLLRWCLQSAIDDARGDAERQERVPNARFIVLDPNGEYAKTFSDIENTTVINISAEPGDNGGAVDLNVPGWLWNSSEWASVLAARPGVQRPVLNEALRTLRAGADHADPPSALLDRIIRGYDARVREAFHSGQHAAFPHSANFGQVLDRCREDLDTFALLTHYANTGEQLLDTINAVVSAPGQTYTSRGTVGYNGFSSAAVKRILDAFDALGPLLTSPGPASLATNIDAPTQFKTEELVDRIEFLVTQPDYSSNAQHISPMSLRLRTILADERVRSVMARDDEPTLQEWIEQYLGDPIGEPHATVTVVDLSLVPTDVVHTAVSVIGRVIFEALQRYRKVHRDELPTVLVLEEAHTFVAARAEETDVPSARQMCRNVFERIAREGRKFGLSLVLSSQRPSELSQTVLAQCNSFLLHRLVNDIDQALVKRLVPDALGDLLSELPSLPARRAILLGWASPMPALVQITELDETHRPQSKDPRFWDVWTGREARDGGWQAVIDKWA